MRSPLVAILIILIPLCAQAGPTGKPRVIDGNLIEIAGQPIRLHGIDAPDSGQTCLENGKRWHCGANAAFALARIIGGHWVVCRQREPGSDKRITAVCRLAGPEGPEINRRMVAQGWALADRRASQAYVTEEAAARKARRGLWRGRFVPPRDWRRGERLK